MKWNPQRAFFFSALPSPQKSTHHTFCATLTLSTITLITHLYAQRRGSALCVQTLWVWVHMYSCTFFLLCMARIINRKLLSRTSTLYSDGYLQPVAQHSVQRSTVNTTSLISIVADEARDNSGRTEPDTVPADKHSLRAEAVMCRECLAAVGIFRRGYRHFFLWLALLWYKLYGRHKLTPT